MPDPLRAFVEETFLVDFEEDGLTEDSDLFREGVMDSFGYVQLLRFLRETYGVEVGEDDLAAGVLVSLRGVREFVAAKTAPGSAG